MRLREIGAALLVLVAGVVQSAAQPAFDQKLPMGASGVPMSSYPISLLVSTLTQLTGVPIGVELVQPARPFRGVALSGLTLREALDAIARAGDYEWETHDGVVILRTRLAANAQFNPLELHMEPVRLDDIVAQQALAVTCAHLGSDLKPLMADRRRFSVAFPGGTVLDWLNAVVRSHGAMSWAFTWFTEKSSLPVAVTFLTATHPVMCHVPGVPPSAAVDSNAVAESRAVPDGAVPDFLDRPVAQSRFGGDLAVLGVYASSIQQLAQGVDVSIGFQEARPALPFPGGPFRVSGLPLRQVLDTMVAADPRYEWRVVDDVVVILPVEAWNDPEHPLSGRVDPQLLEDVPFGEVVQKVMEIMGARVERMPFPDSRRVRFDFPPGTVLDLLCAMARTHGNLMWVYSDPEPEAQARTDHQHQLTVTAAGTGLGVPVR